MIACSSGGANRTFTTGLGVGLNAWHIMSGPGTFHPSHFDANGFQTIITLREGLKGWMWGRIRNPSRLLTPVPTDREDWHWDLFKDCDIYFIVLGPGDTGYVSMLRHLYEGR